MKSGMLSLRLDPAEHPQRRLVGAAVERAVQRGHARGDRRVRVDLGGADAAHRARRAVLLVVGVEDEQDVERVLEPRIGLVADLGHLVDHREEVARIGQLVVRINVRLALVVAERERRQRRHLGQQPDHLDVPDVVVVDLARLGIERRQRADRRQQHPHRVRVVPEALHELLDVLVHERVDRDVVDPLVELQLGRKLSVNQQVRDLEVARLLGELLDRVATVLEDPLLPVDVRNRGATRGGRHERRVVGQQAEVILVDLDVAKLRGADRPVFDRNLVLLAGSVVGDRQGLSRRHCAGAV